MAEECVQSTTQRRLQSAEAVNDASRSCVEAANEAAEVLKTPDNISDNDLVWRACKAHSAASPAVCLDKALSLKPLRHLRQVIA